MTTRVDWARHDDRLRWLPTDRRGIPVPWINAWGPESPALRYDRHLGAIALAHRDDWAAGPDFTRQAPQRQRESALTHRCQVCGHRPIRGDLRLVLTAGISLSLEDTPGPAYGRVVVQEPWLCAWCADVAVTRCPALIRRRHTDQLVVAAIDPDDVLLVSSVGTVDTYPWAGAVPMWVRLALLPEIAQATSKEARTWATTRTA